MSPLLLLALFALSAQQSIVVIPPGDALTDDAGNVLTDDLGNPLPAD